MRGRPFQPGQSGNPSGRPKNRPTITAALRRALDEPGQVDEVARTILRLAIEGHPAAMRHLLDRVDGPVRVDAPSAVVVRVVEDEPDLSLLTTDELKTLQDLMTKATPSNRA